MSANIDERSPRLCHISKWDNFDGYGFNLHAEKGKPGQYIGKVDDSSPAEAAGLRQGDRILEVNGESIANKTHKEVVELIKGLPNETNLLVVDQGDTYILDSTKKSEEQANNNSKEKENGVLNLSMTAAELRAKLASRKKYDPKKEALDFKMKFDIVQKL